MKKLYKFALVFALTVLVGMTASGCGGKKEPEEAASQVMKLTITPEVTPTLAPEQINPDAVEKTGNLVMVNEYTAAQRAGAVDAVLADLEAANADAADNDATEDGNDEDME